MDKKNYNLAVKLRHELHEHPEVSNNEVWTKQHVINFLKEHTELEIVDKGKWFFAVYKAGKGKKNIAFRADFDALPMDEYIDLPYGSKFPGVSHKCGHDGHTASLAGLALEVDQNGADNNVYFLFQHAEETGDGGAEAAVFITENNIDEIFAYHNMGFYPIKSIITRNGVNFCASKGMVIHMEGIPSHASQPEKGKNPAYAIANIISSIPEFILPNNNKGMVLCTIVQIDVGERAFGTSASSGDLCMTIRALYEEEMDRLQKNLEDIAIQEADKYGLGVSFEYYDVYPETFNHEESTDKIRQASKNKGYELIEREYADRSSEDFGYYTKLTKGAYFLIGNGEDYPPTHTKEYDFNDEIIEVAVDMFKELLEIEK